MRLEQPTTSTSSNTTILDATINRAVIRGYIPSSEANAVRQRILTLSSKYSINPNDFAILTFTESRGMDPRADNGSGCYGIIQFCEGTGASTVGYPGASASQIANLSVLQQLELTDKYFSSLGLKPGSGLEDLYLTVLFPAARNITDRNTPLPIPPQADILYTTGSSRTGVITRESLKKGLESEASSYLGIPVNGTIGNPISSSVSSAAGALQGALTSLSTFITTGLNCAPPEYSIPARLTYTGCSTKVTQTKQGNTPGLGFPAQGVTALGAGSNGTVDLNQPYTGPLLPGGFIKPVSLPTSSSFGYREHPISKTLKFHEGIDFEGPGGTPVYASADGVIDPSTSEDSGGYGKLIVIQHASGFYTLYAHLSRIAVAVGQAVKQGQIIGNVGSTGYSTGDHLHFEIRTGSSSGRALNPVDFIGNA